MAFVDKNFEESSAGRIDGMPEGPGGPGRSFFRTHSAVHTDLGRPLRGTVSGKDMPGSGLTGPSPPVRVPLVRDRVKRPVVGWDADLPYGLGRQFITSLTGKPVLILMAFFVFLYIIPLGVRPLAIPDETRYAEIPREMIASGNWISPRLDGLRYFEKPVLGLWAIGWSMQVFGETSFAMRLPSALSMGLSALFLYLLVGKYGPERKAGGLAAGIFLTCPMVYALGVFNVLDGVLSLFLTGALIIFYMASQTEETGRRNLLMVLFGACCSLACLTKGFLAFAVPVSVIVPFMIWEGQWRKMFSMAVPALPAALVAALPWAVAVYLQEPDFWRYFFWVEHIQRFLSGQSQHPEPFWFFLPVVLAGTMPWTCLLPSAIKGLSLKGSLTKYAVCWFLFPFLFFSMSRGKLATYILPCFAPLALLMATGLYESIQNNRVKALVTGSRLWAGILFIAAWGLLITQNVDFFGIVLYGPDEKIKVTVAVGLLLLWAAMAWGASRMKDMRQGIVLFCLAPALFYVGFHHLIPRHSLEEKSPGAFLRQHQADLKPDTLLAADRDLVTAVCWFYKRDDVFLLEKAGELSYGAGFEDSRHRLLSLEDFRKLVESNQGTRDIVVIATTGYANQLIRRFKPPACRDSQFGFTLVRY